MVWKTATEHITWPSRATFGTNVNLRTYLWFANVTCWLRVFFTGSGSVNLIDQTQEYFCWLGVTSAVILEVERSSRRSVVRSPAPSGLHVDVSLSKSPMCSRWLDWLSLPAVITGNCLALRPSCPRPRVLFVWTIKTLKNVILKSAAVI